MSVFLSVEAQASAKREASSSTLALGGSLSDILGTESDLVYRRMDDKVEKQLLRAALARLPLREQQIMQLRFGLGGAREMTQKEVADALGISQSYISRLEKRILSRLNVELTRMSS